MSIPKGATHKYNGGIITYYRQIDGVWYYYMGKDWYISLTNDPYRPYTLRDIVPIDLEILMNEFLKGYDNGK